MTDRALHGASLEATVGQLTTGSPRSAAAARAVSSTLPPPAPTIVRAPSSRASAFTRSTSASEHSPPKRCTACRRPASPRLASHVSASRPMTVLPAMISAGPSSPSAAISRPSAAVAPLPCVYRPGEQKTVRSAIGIASFGLVVPPLDLGQLQPLLDQFRRLPGEFLPLATELGPSLLYRRPEVARRRWSESAPGEVGDFLLLV